MNGTPSDSAYQRTLLYRFKLLYTKMWNLHFFFFARRKIMDACLFYFFQGLSYRPNGPRISENGSFKRKLKVLVPFLSDRNKWEATRAPPRHFFSQTLAIEILKKSFCSSTKRTLLNSSLFTLKFDSFSQLYFFYTIKIFSVMSVALRRIQPLIYTEYFLFVLFFNVAPCFRKKKLVSI